MSERTWQAGDRTLWRAKNADTFKPMGPWIETDFDLAAAHTIVRVNGAEKIRFKTDHMLFGPATFISRMSQYMTLYPGRRGVDGHRGRTGKRQARRHDRHRDHRHRHLDQPGGARRDVGTSLTLYPESPRPPRCARHPLPHCGRGGPGPQGWVVRVGDRNHLSHSAIARHRFATGGAVRTRRSDASAPWRPLRRGSRRRACETAARGGI